MTFWDRASISAEKHSATASEAKTSTHTHTHPDSLCGLLRTDASSLCHLSGNSQILIIWMQPEALFRQRPFSSLRSAVHFMVCVYACDGGRLEACRLWYTYETLWCVYTCAWETFEAETTRKQRDREKDKSVREEDKSVLECGWVCSLLGHEAIPDPLQSTR